MVNSPGSLDVVHQPTALITGSEARSYATELANSTMISPYFRGSVSNVLFAMELGQSYGLKPVSVIQHIHVFETTVEDKKTGRVDTVLKAGLSAALMVYLARRDGHIVNTTATPSFAKTTIVRGDSIYGKLLKGDISPDELEHYSKILATLKDMGVDPKATSFTESVWNTDKARTAGLVDSKGEGKGNWKKYPHSMMSARSKTDGVKLACEEVLIQIGNAAEQIGQFSYEGVPIDVQWKYTADELGASITDEGERVYDDTVRPQQAQRTQRTSSRAVAPVDSDPPARERVVVTPSAADAARDIAAQAAADPSKAGWHGGTQKTAQAPAAASPATDRIGVFIRTKNADQIADWAQKLNAGNEDAAVKEERITTVMSRLVEEATSGKVMDTVRALCELSETDTGAKVEMVAEVHKAIKGLGRDDTPVTYTPPGAEASVTSGLGEAVMAYVKPLISALQVG